MMESVSQKVWHKGHVIGIEEGKIEERKNIARNLLMVGADEAIILQATGLSPQELARINRNLSGLDKVEHMAEKAFQKQWQKGHVIGIEEGKIEGQIEGKAEGKVEGKIEGIETVARNLLMIGTEEAIIIQASGISPEELTRIKNQQ
jgi:predicted transposase YdaD